MTLPLRLTGDGSVESPVPSEHVGRATYREWLWRHVPANQKYSRLYAYDDFVELWPSLADWFAAPLSKRMFDTENPVPGRNPHGGASVIMSYLSYLSYLSLVHGIRLDYDLLFARTFASPFTASARTAGLGIDPDTFERYVSRLVQLGYSTQGALTALKWSFGRMLLHRGNPDMTALTMADVGVALRSRLVRGSSLGRTGARVL